MQKKIHNIETGEITIIDMTPEEIAEAQKIAEESAREQAEAEAKLKSRQELLERLGLTDHDVKVLLSGSE